MSLEFKVMQSGAQCNGESPKPLAATSISPSQPALSMSSRRSHSSKESLNEHDNPHSPHLEARESSQFENLIPMMTTDPVEKPGKSHRPLTRLQPSFRQIALQWWLWELLACIGSLLAILAIVVFLKCYDGRPQPQWPTYITISSIVSLFTALVKAPLLLSTAACISQAKWTHYQPRPRPLKDFVLYDDASRGPLGSISLLWLLKGK
jgi:Protein of unknown function (DUF3176)